MTLNRFRNVLFYTFTPKIPHRVGLRVLDFLLHVVCKSQVAFVIHILHRLQVSVQFCMSSILRPLRVVYLNF